MSSIDVYTIECSGSIRCNSRQLGINPWKSGKFILTKSKQNVTILVSRQDGSCLYTRQIVPAALSNVICKNNHLLVDLKDGSSLQLAKPHSVPHQTALYNKLKEIKESKVSSNIHASVPSLQPVASPVTKSPYFDIPKSSCYTQVKTTHTNSTTQSESPESIWLTSKKDKSNDAKKSVDSFYGSTQPRQVELFSSDTPSRKRPLTSRTDTNVKRHCPSDTTYSWHRPLFSPKKDNHALQGFSNLGNTCYMNAILQALDGLQCLVTDLQCLKKNSPDIPHSTLIYNLIQLLSYKHKSKATESGKRDLLLKVKHAISTSAKRFSGHQQHDAHEFLSQVLDQMKEEIIKMKKDNSDESDPEIFINPTIQTFQFDVMHSLTCNQCGEILTKKEEFNDLSIDIPTSSSGQDISLQDALDTFFAEDTIDYACEKCPSKTSKAVHTFCQLPRVLILHVKRYHQTSSKISRRVIIPTYITLRHHCMENTESPHPPNINPDILNAPKSTSCTEKNGYTFKRNPVDPKTKPHTKITAKTEERSPSIKCEEKMETMDAIKHTNDQPEQSDQPIDYVEAEMILPDMSDEEMLQLALQRSLCESTNTTPVSSNFNDLSDGMDVGFTSIRDKSLKDKSAKKQLHFDNNGNAVEKQISKRILNKYSYSKTKKSTVEAFDTMFDNENEDLFGDSDMKVMESDEGDIVKQVHKKNADVVNIDISDSFEEIFCDGDNKVRKGDKSYSATKVFCDGDNKGTECDKNTPLRKVLCDVGDNNVIESDKDDSLETLSGDSDGYEIISDRKESFRDFILKAKERNALHGDKGLSSRRKDYCDVAHVFGISDNDRLLDTFPTSNPKNVSQHENHSTNEKLPAKETKKKSREEPDIGFNSNTRQNTKSTGELIGGGLQKELPDISLPTEDNWTELQEVTTDQSNTKHSEDDKENIAPSTPSKEQTETSSRFIDLASPVKDDFNQEEEDLRQAKELSLREYESHMSDLDQNQSIQSKVIKRSPEDQEAITSNYNNGHLPHSYRLASVVSHLGESSSRGHYICDVYDVESKCWFSYDDTQVSKISQTEVCANRQRSGYIFFYINRNILENLQSCNKAKTSV